MQQQVNIELHEIVIDDEISRLLHEGFQRRISEEESQTKEEGKEF